MPIDNYNFFNDEDPVLKRNIAIYLARYKMQEDRKFGKKIIKGWLIAGLLTSALFCSMQKTPSVKAEAQIDYSINTCPLYGMDDLIQTQKKLKWTQKVLLEERQKLRQLQNQNQNQSQSQNHKNSLQNQALKKVTVSPSIIAYLKPISKKYHKKFDLNEAEMTKYLISLLRNENGLQSSFYPKHKNQKYLVLGDNGNGCHAWQIDRRYHKTCKPMTFEESGDYAISHVLLKGYKMAKKRGLKDPHKAALTYYNSGQFNDKYSTNNYGQRAYKAWKGLA